MSRLFRTAAGTIFLLIGACGSGPPTEESDQAYDGAQDQLADATFEDVGDTGDCTEDCSGHDAGFEWARDQGVTDPSECSGDSQSFVEGCEAYASAIETAAEDDEPEEN